MNEHQTAADQTDEDLLTYAVSDEALEAAAGTEGLAAPAVSISGPDHVCRDPCG
jgi:hypothetical protein